MAVTTVELQELVTVEGANTTDVAQPDDRWFDAVGFQNAAFYVEIRELTNATVHIETAVDADESAFVGMDGSAVTSTTTIPVSTDATTPLLRWVRWRIEAGMSWTATFRVAATFKSE